VDSQPGILRYQRDRSLADAPGFSVGLQLRLPDDTKVYLALGSAEFTLTFRNIDGTKSSCSGNVAVVFRQCSVEVSVAGAGMR
jgi:hypothetical protein